MHKESSESVNVGIHIRWYELGYVINPPSSFYSLAMEKFRRKHQSKKVWFYVASDDLERSQRIDALSDEHVIFLNGTSPILDLATLINCGDTILSSGTFGWWAAWAHIKKGEMSSITRECST